MHATLGQLLIRLSTASQLPRPRMEIRTMAMRSPISRVNDCPDVHVPVNRILDLCIQMDRLLGGLPQRSTFSRRPYV